MSIFRNLAASLRSYVAHPDPRVALANLVALVVASNQPFYPLYVWWLVSTDISATLYTFLSTPFFLAVPAVSRMNSVAGRVLLPLAGIGNAILCAKLFGVQSAVEIFLIPCAVLALLLFRPSERAVSFAVAGLCFAVFFFLHDRYGAPYETYSALEYQAFVRLNAMSAGALTAFIAILFSRLLADLESSLEGSGGNKPR